jgi:threonylcarbamoyladenosine tRNA methylthiotransferase MtaB
MPSVLIHTLGCKLNQLESEALRDSFIRHGFDLYVPQSGIPPPALVIINTCTVTSKADQKARRVIRKSLRDYSDSRVIVTGCYAELEQDTIKELGHGGCEHRLFVFKGREKNAVLDLPDLLKENKSGLQDKIKTRDGNLERQTAGPDEVFQFFPERFYGHTRAFLKIQDGCDRHCTYCRIRLARGKSTSLDSGEVLTRLKTLEVKQFEAVLTGVNICQYSDDKNTAGLTRLLEFLLSGTEKINIRLSSLDPVYIDNNFIKILSHDRIRPHFHLSVQSASNIVLGKMGRTYNRETLENAVSLLRSVKDDPFIACDIISGFPGETVDEFEKTLEFCRKMNFAWIHVFPYSKRPGTKAWEFADNVNGAEVTKRVKTLGDLARQGRAAYTRSWLGREVDVLVEKGNLKFCRGISENYLKLLINYDGKRAPPPGAVLRCKLMEKPYTDRNENYDAVAETVIC